MRKAILIATVAVVVCWVSLAHAAEQTYLWCPSIPYCCEISCVSLDIDCDYCCYSNEPLTVEFLDRDKAVLGSVSTGAGWCCWCDEMVFRVDPPVSADAVCYVRLVKADGDCSCFWLSLKVYCGDRCCGKWCKVWKGCVWCWEPVPVPPPPPEPEPVVEPPPPPPPVVAPPPEPKPEYDYFPPQEAEEEEIIVVEGRG